MNLSRLLTGILMIAFGLFIIYEEFVLATFLVGGIFIVIGLVIIFNRKEDEIEKIKTKSSGGKK